GGAQPVHAVDPSGGRFSDGRRRGRPADARARREGAEASARENPFLDGAAGRALLPEWAFARNGWTALARGRDGRPPAGAVRDRARVARAAERAADRAA